MKNKITDLNNHLFAQLERLGEEGLKSDEIERECRRTDAIVAVSEQIIRSATISLKAAELIAQNGGELGAKVKPGSSTRPQTNKAGASRQSVVK